MLVVRLFCDQGISTSVLVTKMRKTAQKLGKEVEIQAFPTFEMEKQLDGADCALLGPQVGYLKNKMAKLCAEKNVPLDVIPAEDYGAGDGEKILEFAESLAKGSAKK